MDAWGLGVTQALCLARETFRAGFPNAKPNQPLGACCLGLQRYDAAIKVYNLAVQFGALDAELHYYLGQAYYFDKQYEPAFDLMRFARVLDEQDPASQGKITAFATQMLETMKPLVSAEQAAMIDLRPS